MNVFVLTVGGSNDPIVHAIHQNRCDLVIFIASHSEGASSPKVSSSLSVPEIVKSVGLEVEHYRVEHTTRPDDLLDVWETCRRIQGYTQGARVIANYTGGTKTMSSAVVAFGLIHGWELQVQAAQRSDLIRVTSNDRSRIQSGIHAARIELALEQAKQLKERGDYEGARTLLEQHPSGQNVSEDLQAQIDYAILESEFLDALDRFDFAEAASILGGRGRVLGRIYGSKQGGQLTEYIKTLEWLKPAPVGDGRSTPGVPKAPYLLVTALIESAARAANRGRYDDAFSRLYRATELTAQIALQKEHGIRTSDVDLQRIPQGFLAPIEASSLPLRLALTRSWELLERLNSALGLYYRDCGAHLKNWLKIRNESWLAHGYTPVSANTWHSHGQPWATWIQGAIECARIAK